MADALTTYSGLTNEQSTFHVKRLIERFLPEYAFYRFGQKDSLPMRNGDALKWRTIPMLSDATTALTEGTPPYTVAMSVSVVSATMATYGNAVKLTDDLIDYSLDDMVREGESVIRDNARQTIDTLIRDTVKAGTTVQYSGTATGRSGVSDNIAVADIKKAVRTLKASSVPYAAGDFYVAFVHPNPAYDLRNDSAWVNAAQYAGSRQIFTGEIGTLYGVRFIETAQAPVFSAAGSGSVDVYGTIIIGQTAYGVPTLKGRAFPQIFVKPLGSAGADDPLNQYGTVGWKAKFTTGRLKESAIVRIESAASA